MSIQQTLFLRTATRLLAVLAVFGIMLTANQTPVAAQQCSPGIGCSMLPYCNLTMPPTTYQIRFLLCCGGITSISAPYIAFPSPGPCPPFLATQTYIPPAGCTVFGVASIIPAPPLGYVFNIAACTLTIN